MGATCDFLTVMSDLPLNIEQVQIIYEDTIEIFYSEEDKRYIAILPELLGCSVFRKTPEEVLKENRAAYRSRLLKTLRF
ncbi:hypothetical protein MSIBF_A4510004 [groundwater metagenome]|uniref:Uncharacterized protein n=1 Tax=groundwater metagenome TaxID=717931 RepID=A0A098ECG4_9ZZZZ